MSWNETVACFLDLILIGSHHLNIVVDVRSRSQTFQFIWPFLEFYVKFVLFCIIIFSLSLIGVVL